MVYVSKYWQIFKNNPENLKYEFIICLRHLRSERIYVGVGWSDLNRIFLLSELMIAD